MVKKKSLRTILSLMIFLLVSMNINVSINDSMNFNNINDSSLSFQIGSKAYADNYTKTVNFTKSTARTRSSTVTIPGLVNVTNVTVDTGDVTYSVNGDNVTVNVSGGSYVDSYKPSKTVEKTINTGSSLPANSYYYSDGSGYSGSIPLVEFIDNSYEEEKVLSRTFSRSKNNTCTLTYNEDGNITKTEYSWKDPITGEGTNNHPTYPINQDGYSGNIPKKSYSIGGLRITQTYPDGSTKQTKQDFRGYYEGTLTKKVYETIESYAGKYRGTVYKDRRYYYAYTVTIHYTVNSSPSLTVNSPIQNTVYSESNTSLTPAISVSDPDGDNLTCRLFVDLEDTPKEEITVSNTATDQNISFGTMNLDQLTEGIHTLKFEVSDWETTTTEIVNIVIDKTPPQLSNVVATSTDSTITINGDGNDFESGLNSLAYRYTFEDEVSSWVGTSSYTQLSLEPNKLYSLKMEVRDTQNHITSKLLSVYTKAETPKLSISNIIENSIDISTIDNNPSITDYQIQIGEQFVNSLGELTATEQWIILNNKSVTMNFLNQNTVYHFTAKARNQEGIETPSSLSEIGRTLSTPPSTIDFDVEKYSITMNWNEITEVLGYDIEVDGIVINNGSSNTYSHQELTPDTRHTYRVRVINAGGIGNWSPLLTKYTLPYPPDMPVNIDASLEQTEIALTWDEPARAASYEVEADGVVVKDINNASFAHKNLNPDTIHSYRVRAINPGGVSSWSEEVTFMTLPVPPLTPENINATQTKTSVTVVWDIADRATGYEVEADGMIIDVQNMTTFTHEGLDPATGHTYRIRAKNRGGKSSWSEPLDITTYPEKPEIPSNVMATAENNEITVTWYKVPYGESYDIEIDGTTIVNITDTMLVHENVLSDTSHAYRIRAKNISGLSEWSEEVHIATLPDTIKSLTNVIAIITSDSITLSWDAVVSEAQYYVEVDGKLIENGTNTTFKHSELESGTYHTYKIKYKDSEDNGDWCSVLALSTLPNPPNAPTGITIVPTNDSIELRWEKVENATGYDVEVDGEVIDNGDIAMFIHVNLEPGISHTYRIRAKNPAGTTAWSTALQESTINPTYVIDCYENEEFNLSLIVSNIQDFTGEKFVIEYNSDEIKVVDLYEFSLEKDLITNGYIPNTNIYVEYSPGRIEFMRDDNIQPGTSWSGEVSTVTFRSKIAGTTNIIFTIEK